MAITLVQTATSQTGSPLTLSSSTTGGNCLIVCVMDSAPASTAPAVTAVTLGGSAGNFSQIAAATATGFAVAAIWADPNCAGGQTAVAVTETNTGGPIIVAYEVSGLAASSVLDKSSTGNSTTAVGPWSSGTTATTTQAAEFWAGAVSTWSSDTLTGPASPWTNTANLAHGGGGMTGYKIASATGTATYSGTNAFTDEYAAVVVTLKPAAATVDLPPAIRLYGAARRLIPTRPVNPATYSR